ncbi:hypothetical protein WJX84_012424, partial [Apatococcus fuscideae]
MPGLAEPVPLQGREESGRLSTVEALRVLEDPTDVELKALTQLARTAFGGSSLSGVSVVGKRNAWYKALWCKGPEGVERRRDWAFCSWALLPDSPEVLVCEDTQLDARFQTSPHVIGEPYIRFYAGAPLIASNGYRVGTFCVADFEPRVLCAEQVNLLCQIAEAVMREMEEAHFMRLGSDSLASMLRPKSCFRSPILFCDISRDAWNIQYSNKPWADAAGLLMEELQGNVNLWELFQPSDTSQAASKQMEEALIQEVPFRVIVQRRFHPTSDVDDDPLCLEFRPTGHGPLDAATPRVGIPSHIPTAAEAPLFDEDEEEEEPKIWLATIVRKKQTKPRRDTKRASRANTTRSGSSDTMSVASWNSGGSLASAASRGTSTSTQMIAAANPGLAGLSADELDRNPGSLSPALVATVQKLGAVQAAMQDARSPPLIPVEEVSLGVILAAGRDSHIFRGKWNGAPVAVKVMKTPYADCIHWEACQLWVPPEASLALGFYHPNIVRTYKFACPAEVQDSPPDYVSASPPAELASLNAAAVNRQATQAKMVELAVPMPSLRDLPESAAPQQNGRPVSIDGGIMHGGTAVRPPPFATYQNPHMPLQLPSSPTQQLEEDARVLEVLARLRGQVGEPPVGSVSAPMVPPVLPSSTPITSEDRLSPVDSGRYTQPSSLSRMPSPPGPATPTGGSQAPFGDAPSVLELTRSQLPGPLPQTPLPAGFSAALPNVQSASGRIETGPMSMPPSPPLFAPLQPSNIPRSPQGRREAAPPPDPSRSPRSLSLIPGPPAAGPREGPATPPQAEIPTPKMFADSGSPPREGFSGQPHSSTASPVNAQGDSRIPHPTHATSPHSGPHPADASAATAAPIIAEAPAVGQPQDAFASQPIPTAVPTVTEAPALGQPRDTRMAMHTKDQLPDLQSFAFAPAHPPRLQSSITQSMGMPAPSLPVDAAMESSSDHSASTAAATPAIQAAPAEAALRPQPSQQDAFTNKHEMQDAPMHLSEQPRQLSITSQDSSMNAGRRFMDRINASGHPGDEFSEEPNPFDLSAEPRDGSDEEMGSAQPIEALDSHQQHGMSGTALVSGQPAADQPDGTRKGSSEYHNENVGENGQASGNQAAATLSFAGVPEQQPGDAFHVSAASEHQPNDKASGSFYSTVRKAEMPAAPRYLPGDDRAYLAPKDADDKAQSSFYSTVPILQTESSDLEQWLTPTPSLTSLSETGIPPASSQTEYDLPPQLLQDSAAVYNNPLHAFAGNDSTMSPELAPPQQPLPMFPDDSPLSPQDLAPDRSIASLTTGDDEGTAVSPLDVAPDAGRRQAVGTHSFNPRSYMQGPPPAVGPYAPFLQMQQQQQQPLQQQSPMRHVGFAELPPPIYASPARSITQSPHHSSIDELHLSEGRIHGANLNAPMADLSGLQLAPQTLFDEDLDPFDDEDFDAPTQIPTPTRNAFE